MAGQMIGKLVEDRSDLIPSATSGERKLVRWVVATQRLSAPSAMSSFELPSCIPLESRR